MSRQIREFQHMVPATLRVTDDMRRSGGVTAFLTASEVAAGWQIGVIIQRGPLQAGSMSDMVVGKHENIVQAMQEVAREVRLLDGVDHIAAKISLGDAVFMALFPPQALQGMIRQPYKPPAGFPPGQEEVGPRLVPKPKKKSSEARR